jgi:hypothetical protein
MRSWRNARRAWLRATWSARALEVQLLSGARMPPCLNWKRSPPIPGRLPGRIRQEDLMAGCSVGRGDMTLDHGATLVRLQPGQHQCLFGDNGSMPLRYGGGRGSTPRAGSTRM